MRQAPGRPAPERRYRRIMRSGPWFRGMPGTGCVLRKMPAPWGRKSGPIQVKFEPAPARAGHPGKYSSLDAGYGRSLPQAEFTPSALRYTCWPGWPAPTPIRDPCPDETAEKRFSSTVGHPVNPRERRRGAARQLVPVRFSRTPGHLRGHRLRPAAPAWRPGPRARYRILRRHHIETPECIETPE